MAVVRGNVCGAKFWGLEGQFVIAGKRSTAFRHPLHEICPPKVAEDFAANGGQESGSLGV